MHAFFTDSRQVMKRNTGDVWICRYEIFPVLREKRSEKDKTRKSKYQLAFEFLLIPVAVIIIMHSMYGRADLLSAGRQSGMR